MAVLYVASDERGIGKTAFCVTFADQVNHLGKKAAVFKPLSPRTSSGPDPDVGIYQRLLDQPEMGYSFQLSNGGLTTKLTKDIKAAFDKVGSGQDLLLVEGSSEVSAEATAQLVEALDAQVLVLVGYRPDLDASRLTGWQALLNERLLGFVTNGLTRYQGTGARTGLLPSMSAAGMNSLGVIPEDRTLLGVRVGQLATHLEGRFVVCEELSDGLVEYFLVGGLGLDSGELYFGTRENKAVIVRGDRPDVQMAALATSTACMVLTQGIEPIEYVRNEAELEEVPVIVVQSDTLGTMASLNTVLDRAMFDHPRKRDRFAELLREHVDLSAIYAALGIAT